MAKTGSFKVRKRAEARSKDTILCTLRKVDTQTWMGVRMIAAGAVPSKRHLKYVQAVVNDALNEYVDKYLPNHRK
jgi:hypothetical protein